jgi:glucuronoarabinoxylan endo-1,4-beta-xylanase
MENRNKPRNCFPLLLFLLVSAPAWGAEYAINASVVHQSIDGFGAASNQPEDPCECCTPTQADLLFSPDSGIGLSLLRVSINADGSMNGLNAALLAQARGASIWFAQWSPPAAYKSVNDIANGGHLCYAAGDPYGCTAGHYPDYASQQTTSLLSAKAAGVTSPYALSIQNESDVVASWDSCTWTARNLHDYVSILRTTLNANGLGSTVIIMPEQTNWTFDLASATMADPATAAMVGILAAHDYSYVNPPSAPTNYGKPVWETEVSTFEGYDPSITSGLRVATMVHNFLTQANVNAWHFWLTMSSDYSFNCQLMDGSGTMLKRGYALGQFSRFVRPGWHRIDVSGSGDVLVSAYRHPGPGGGVAIVAINPDPSAQSTTFSLSGLSVTTITPWITSDSLSLASQTAVSVSGSVFTYDLPASSITTFHGHEDVCAPQCGGKACGSDGCGGSCGSCHNGQTCSNGACVGGRDGGGSDGGGRDGTSDTSSAHPADGNHASSDGGVTTLVGGCACRLGAESREEAIPFALAAVGALAALLRRRACRPAGAAAVRIPHRS